MRFQTIGIAIVVAVLAVCGSLASPPAHAAALEAVEGRGCYAYGDDETVTVAKDKAMARAREQAVSGYRVWVESSSQVEDLQLKKDSIHSISAGLLRHVKVDQVEKHDQEVCMMIKGQIDPESVTKEIERRKKQKEIKNLLLSPTLNPGGIGGLKMWINHADGRYVEDDHLEVYVQSDRDVYLKLDYFQADGTVVHLVPNMFRKQARISKGETYVFGGKDSPERFVISGPFGDEVIKAIVSTKPFSGKLEPNEIVSQSESYLKTLKMEVETQKKKRTSRGVRVLSGTSAALFTKSREIVRLERALDGP